VTAREVTFDVPKALWMTANGRIHWAVRAKRTKILRELAALKGWNLEPFTTRARAVAHISYPRNGRADPANAAPTVKALIDGLVDGGVLADDDHEHLLGPDYRRDPATGVTGLWRVRIVLEEAT
jgi:crossover junction endodeoxyribonuclease RusA